MMWYDRRVIQYLLIKERYETVKRLNKMTLAMLTLSLFLTACGGTPQEETMQAGDGAVETELAEIETEVGIETETEEEEILPAGMYRSELTNELIDESLRNQRPIAAMVDNESIALPHYGLTQADVIYEMMNSTANGRITRFMVLVKDWGQIDQLGSIRSVRPTNIILAAEWNAVVCHDGGPFYINEYLEQYGDHFSGTFSRVNNGKSREYTEYILPGDLEKNFSNTGISTEYASGFGAPHYQFATEDKPVDLSSYAEAIDASLVDLPFPHNGSWLEYNEEDQLYYYSEYGKAHLDPGNGNEQLSFKNLLIQNCSFQQYDEHGYMIFNCIAGYGEGYYITNGHAIPVVWRKDSMTSPTVYFDPEGSEIELNTGKTYVALVPSDDWDDLVIE